MSEQTSLAKSHAEMLAFIQMLIKSSDRFGSRSRTAQRHYDKATKIAAKARKALSRSSGAARG